MQTFPINASNARLKRLANDAQKIAITYQNLAAALKEIMKYESNYSSLPIVPSNLGTSISNSTEYSLECNTPTVILHDAFPFTIMRLHMMEQR